MTRNNNFHVSNQVSSIGVLARVYEMCS